jgi:hypothetical protein
MFCCGYTIVSTNYTNDMWTQIWNNREWLFSGIGVLIITVISGLIFRKKRQEKNISPKGDGHNYAAETINVHHSTGLSITDVKELAKSVFIENFPKLQEVAKQEAEKNRDLFITELDQRIKDKLTEEEINKFNKPDIQYTLKDAILSASRKDNPSTRTILSNLIVERVKNDGIEFKEIVYNEAIGTIPRLTKNHLNILAFAFITKYARFPNIPDWSAFEKIIKNNICPFMDFQNTNAQFQHLEYSDCGNLGIASNKLESIIRSNYNNLFYKEENPFIDKPTYDRWNLKEELKPIFFRKDEVADKYFFTHKTVADIIILRKKLITSGIESFTDYSVQLLNKTKNENEIVAELKQKFDFAEKLLKQFNETGVASLTLTSVGVVVGASHYETITGEKLDIDNWIN